MEKRTIYFNEELHKYTDEFNNVYTSATTLIGKYTTKFDTKKMARICAMSGMRGNPKYAGKTAKQLEAEWAKTTEDACDKGNKKHNFLELAIKNSNGYNRIADSLYINDNLITIDDVIDNHELGRIDLDIFVKQGVDKKYPKIFNILNQFIDRGYRLHAEIGGYHPDYLISGLIDLFLIKDYKFSIIDWKTNKASIKYASGYFEKDVNGKLTNNYIYTNNKFHSPLSHLADSVGNKYSMQLSIYDYLAEVNGLEFEANILCHIQETEDDDGQIIETETLLPIKYMKKDVHTLFNHHKSNNNRNNQFVLSLK